MSLSVSFHHQLQTLMTNLVQVLEDEETHRIDQFLLNDIDEASAAMADLAFTYQLLNVFLIKHQIKIETIQEMFFDALQFARHNG